ncbi:MAG: MerR family transcriptional regulator [Bacterioplanes sp.]|nr:MerR family transcriptional regulator [Bacterioplanes sp.]
MLEVNHSTDLPPIPSKRYFTIGEVADLCQLKAHVLRYWEQEFSQLKPVKRTGNRRYYQRQDILLIREIRQLLHVEGFTIPGARQRLAEQGSSHIATFDRQLIKGMIAELRELEQLLTQDE